MQITSLAVEVMGIEGNRNGGNAGVSRGPKDGPVLVGERIHCNTTPTPDNRAFNDTLVVPGTKTPLVLARWGYRDKKTGQEFRCSHGGPGQPDASADRDDPFSLESYEKKNEN